jgi:5'-methylthioadenosine phosphorylase
MPDIRIGLIGGTGLGEALGAESGQRHDIETPFGPTSSSIVTTRLGEVDVAILKRHGEGHVFNPSAVPYRANIYALKTLGVTHIVASGATGSLREHIKPRDLVIPDQIIDKTCKRANTFYEHAAVHVEFAEPFCPVMRRWLLAAGSKLLAQESNLRIHDGGCYVCMEGPAFSTRAESHMHRAWGGDLIGMTAMPEAKLAREAEIAYASICLPTDYDCWRPHASGVAPQTLLAEIISHLQAATINSVKLLKLALSDVATLRSTPSPAHEALKLAIWSDKSKIPRGEAERIAALWGHYLW